MEYPPGVKSIGNNDCTILEKYTYALVQAARCYNKKAVEILKVVGFFRDNVDPYLYMKENANDTVYVALYIDNNLMIGIPEAIDEVVEQLKRMD